MILRKIFDVSGAMLLAGRREAQVVGSSGCEQLHDMSLFHNLKLKRRKGDSRGSSDGKLEGGEGRLKAVF